MEQDVHCIQQQFPVINEKEVASTLHNTREIQSFHHKQNKYNKINNFSVCFFFAVVVHKVSVYRN